MVGRRIRAVLVNAGLLLLSLVGGCDLFRDPTLAAVFSAQLDRDSAPATLTLDASLSRGPIASYTWDVAGTSHAGVTVSVVLPNAGEYVVRLTVADAEGAKHSASKTFVIRPGQADVTRPIPGNLQLKTAPGQVRAASLTLDNVGALPLEVTIAITAGASWLEVDPGTFSVPADSQQELQVRASCAAAQETRLGGITLATNDPDDPEITIPVALVCTTVPPGSFNLQLRFEDGRFTPSQRAIIEQAAARLEAVIVMDLDDVPDVKQSEVNYCNFGFGFTGTVDDLLILVGAEDIDGPGGTAAMGGSCWLRGGFESTGLPYMGQVTIDRSELAYLEASGLLFPVVLHEFGHALGFSSYVWTNHGLLGFSGITCQAASETWFSGASAVSQWQSLGGTGMVPVADYWSGSCSHWDDLAFGDETMTAFTGAMDLLSTVTIGSLADLGYSVDYAAADPYTLPDDVRARSTAAPLTVRDEVQPPVGWVAPDGTRHLFDDSE